MNDIDYLLLKGGYYKIIFFIIVVESRKNFNEKLTSDDALVSFRSLSEKYINWHSGQEGIGSEIDTEQECS